MYDEGVVENVSIFESQTNIHAPQMMSPLNIVHHLTCLTSLH